MERRFPPRELDGNLDSVRSIQSIENLMTKHNQLSSVAGAAANIRTPINAALFTLLLLLCGCGTPWHVVRQADPNPFLGARQFALQPVAFSNLVVGKIPESTYLERKDPKQQESWQADKQALNDLFAKQLQRSLKGPGYVLTNQAPFTISPRVSRIEPGSYAYPTEISLSVCLLDANGQTLDEVFFYQGVAFELIGGAASGQRIRTASQLLGHTVSAYLRKRTKK
jgi:hypothetical protein